MLLIEHLQSLILLLLILLSPIPLCLAITLINENEKYRNQSQRYDFSLSHFLLVILTGWCVIQVSLSMLLGILHLLSLPYIMCGESFLLIVGIIIFRYLKNRRRLPFSLREILIQKQQIPKLELLIISSIGFVGVIMLERLATRPILDYDSLWYHLPNMVRWYQTASLTMIEPVGDLVFDQTLRYTYTWELLSTLFLIPFQEDFLVHFSKWISWIILGLSIYRVSLLFGANKISSMAASSLVMTVPFVLYNINTIQVDIPLAALFASSLYWGICYQINRYLSDLALLLLSIAILCGIKISGIFYAGLIILVLAVQEAFNRFLIKPSDHNLEVHSDKIVKLMLTISIAAFLFIGGFWYVRNLIEVGNPLGYVEIKIANLTLFPGIIKTKDITDDSLANLFDITNLSHWKTIGIQALVRLQIPFLAMGLQVLFLPYALLKGQRGIKNTYFLTLFMLLIGTLFLYWNNLSSGAVELSEDQSITPFVGQAFRYGFSFISMLGVAAAVSATRLRTRHEIIVLIVLISSIVGIISSSIFEIVKTAAFTGRAEIVWASLLIDQLRTAPQEALAGIFSLLANSFLPLVIYIIFYILVISLLYWLYSRRSNHKLRRFRGGIIRGSQRLILILSLLTIIVSATWVAREKRDLLRREFYGGLYEYIATHTSSEETVGYLFSDRSYLFSGKNLDRKVLYAAPTSAENPQQWVEQLKQLKISIVAVGPIRPEYKSRQELAWLQAADGLFNPVFGEDLDRESVIYRLKNN